MRVRRQMHLSQPRHTHQTGNLNSAFFGLHDRDADMHSEPPTPEQLKAREEALKQHKEQLEEKHRRRCKERARRDFGYGLEEKERSEEQNANREQQREAHKRKGDELETATGFWTSQREREARKSRYDKLEPAKKKAIIQQIMEQRKQAPPVLCTCGKKFKQTGHFNRHLFGSKSGENKPSAKLECVAARQARTPAGWWSALHPSAGLA